MFQRMQKPFVRAKLAQQRECGVLGMMAYHDLAGPTSDTHLVPVT